MLPLQKSLSNVTLDVFAAALPSFKSLGTRKAKLLVENIPDFYTKSVTYLNSKIPEIELFSESSTEMVVDGLESFKLSFFKTGILTLSSSDTCALSDLIFITPSCDNNNPGITTNERIILIMLEMFMYYLFKNLQIRMAR